MLALQKHQKKLRKRLVAAERKLLFFLAWANEQPPEAYELLALGVAAEHRQHAAAVAAAAAAATGGTLGTAVTSSQFSAAHAEGSGGGNKAVLIEEL